MKLADIEPTDIDKVVTLDMNYGYFTGKVCTHEIYEYGMVDDYGAYKEVITVKVTFYGGREFEEERVTKRDRAYD